MGVSIVCKKTGKGACIGSGGFLRFRELVARCSSPEWGKHYETLKDGLLIHEEPGRTEFYKGFVSKTEALLSEKKANTKVVDFCLQSDVDGSIHYGACKVILAALDKSGEDESKCYGYPGHPSPVTLGDLKAILRDCVQTKSDLVWY